MNRLFLATVIGIFGPLSLITGSLSANAQDRIPDRQTDNFIDTCAAQTKPIDINIKNPRGRVVYYPRVSRNDIVRIQRNRARGALNRNWRALGLTLSEFQYGIATSVSLIPIADNKFCVYPASFDIIIGYSGFKVYIDRQYRKGSCEYRTVLDHENTHVSLYRGSLSRRLPELQRTIYSTARRINPVIVSSPQQGARYMQREMQKRLKPVVDRLRRGADAANARIDTPTNYKRVQARCRNW